MFYLSDSVYLGTHTLNWTVNNASATGPRFYLDAFYIYGPELPQPEEYFNMINSFNSDIYYNGGDVYQGGFTGNWTNNAPSFIYKFTGTLTSGFFLLPSPLALDTSKGTE